MNGRGTVHVIGAGVAGLACAVRLAGRGAKIALYEASSRAGGRCRSFHDRVLDRVIDNGNHILLAGNSAVNDYLAAIGASDALTTVEPASFPFLDLASGDRWQVRPNAGPLPWWILAPSRRPPGVGPLDVLAAFGLAVAGRRATVGSALRCSPAALRAFWDPLAVAILNTPVEQGDARLLWLVMRETFLRGEVACRPRFAHQGLGAAFVEPARRYLAAKGAVLRFSAPVRAIEFSNARATALAVDGAVVAVGPDDRVVVAVPPRNATRLIPDLHAPVRMRPIINGHFLVSGTGMKRAGFLGLVGGFAQWIFLREDVVSVTISAGDAIAEWPNEDIAERMWTDVSTALGTSGRRLPPCRIIKEKTATIDQTPANVLFRAPTATRWDNVFLAGDWTDTGLPATIEGAIRSGFLAAERLSTTN
jgi:squalene-associated FAD-dependent desaturase